MYSQCNVCASMRLGQWKPGHNMLGTAENNWEVYLILDLIDLINELKSLAHLDISGGCIFPRRPTDGDCLLEEVYIAAVMSAAAVMAGVGVEGDDEADAVNAADVVKAASAASDQAAHDFVIQSSDWPLQSLCEKCATDREQPTLELIIGGRVDVLAFLLWLKLISCFCGLTCIFTVHFEIYLSRACMKFSCNVYYRTSMKSICNIIYNTYGITPQLPTCYKIYQPKDVLLHAYH